MHFERQVADFVEEGGTAVGHFDKAALRVGGSGEGAPGMAEQFAFHQGTHQGAAVDGHKFTAGPGVVYGARGHFFAGAAFAQQQDRRVGTPELINQTADFADARRPSDQTSRAVRTRPNHGSEG